MDIRCANGAETYEVVFHAIQLGFTGIAVKGGTTGQKIVHLDTRDGIPVFWGYNDTTSRWLPTSAPSAPPPTTPSTPGSPA